MMEINAWTQGKNQRVSLFISSVVGLFNRHSVKPSEKFAFQKL